MLFSNSHVVPWGGALSSTPLSRVNDCPANTYRALRIIDPSAMQGQRNLLYVEMTLVSDWFFEDVNFWELYDLDADPFQLTNAYNSSSPALRLRLASELKEYWHCAGATCK